MKLKSNQTENHKAISGFLKTLVSYRILSGIKITRLKEPPCHSKQLAKLLF